MREDGQWPAEELWGREPDSGAGEGGDNTRNDGKIVNSDSQLKNVGENQDKKI